MADADPGVRRAALTVVECICEQLEEAAIAGESTLCLVLLNQVADLSSQKQACTALDALLEILEILGDSIKEHLELLMHTLSGLLDTAPINVETVVVIAISSVVHTSGNAFPPYFEATIRRLATFL